MIISVINHASAKIADAEIQSVLRALNRQIEGDFAPYWSLSATLRLEGRSGKQPSKQSLADMRGDAVLYLWDKVDVDDALGYHEINHRGIPYGFVFTELSRQMGEHWSVTLSHEALELIGAGKLVTIEGNTNDGGSREGVGVFRRSGRRIRDINLGFIDYGSP